MAKTTTRITYNPTQRYHICRLIQEQYATSGLDDTEFAAKASADLGYLVKAGSIQHYRTEFGITQNKGTGIDASQQVVTLTRRVKQLESFIMDHDMTLPEYEVDEEEASTTESSSTPAETSLQ